MKRKEKKRKILIILLIIVLFFSMLYIYLYTETFVSLNIPQIGGTHNIAIKENVVLCNKILKSIL